MNEAFRFTVGLRAGRSYEALAHTPAPTDGREDAGLGGEGVVGEQSPDRNAAPTKPAQRTLEEGRAGRGVFRRQHFCVGESRGVIDGDMEIFPPCLPCPTAAIAVNPMPDADDEGLSF